MALLVRGGNAPGMGGGGGIALLLRGGSAPDIGGGGNTAFDAFGNDMPDLICGSGTDDPDRAGDMGGRGGFPGRNDDVGRSELAASSFINAVEPIPEPPFEGAGLGTFGGRAGGALFRLGGGGGILWSTLGGRGGGGGGPAAATLSR